jgi:hypothetical protein
MNEHIPEELEQITVSALQQDETGYTLPWAVYLDEGGFCWIRGDYPLFLSPHKEAVLRIRREGDEFYASKETVGDYRYDIRENPMEDWEPFPLIWE